MKKMSLIFTASLLAAAISNAAYAEPTRLFMSESGSTAESGTASLDFDYFGTASANSNGTSAGARVGAFGGEVLINTLPNVAATGFDTPHIGYKRVIMPNLAAYGIISHYNDPAPGSDSVTDFAIGAAYTLNFSGSSVGVDAQLITDDAGVAGAPGAGNGRGGDTTLFLKAGGQFQVSAAPNKLSLVGEVIAENNDMLDTMVNLGLRWSPLKNVTADFIVYHDNGSSANDSMTGIPGAVRLNIAF